MPAANAVDEPENESFVNRTGLAQKVRFGIKSSLRSSVCLCALCVGVTV